MYILYTKDQLFLPMDLEEVIPENHLVRVVNAAVNRLYLATYGVSYGDICVRPEKLDPRSF